jgi:2-oxoglutarate dehydrogenase E1 component
MAAASMQDLVNRANADYLDQLYRQYRGDPASLSVEWRQMFKSLEREDAPRPSAAAPVDQSARRQVCRPAQATEVANLVHAFREFGHFNARLDPLEQKRPPHPLLQLSEYGFGEVDSNLEVGTGGFLGPVDGTLGDLLDKLHTTYCGSIGVEYTLISDKAQRDWLEERMEPTLNRRPLHTPLQKELLRQLAAAQGFEEYLHSRFVGQKRFSAEGAETIVPLMNFLVDEGAALGMDELIIGMAHRGRLNVLANVVGKPLELMLAEFAGTLPHQEREGDGDVKYHLGYSGERVTRCGRRVHLALSFNPSHLELVDPVVEGIVRAKQYYLNDLERTRVVPLLIHGDAAFCGQGIVQETLGLSEMPYWRTGGTIHIIINNQIGFTTMPKQGRFTPYPTDIAKSIQAPIFHVNGDDPEAVVHVAQMAIGFRQRFHTDVLIDLWCYRRHGHNETDEPGFTQPLMYKQITSHPTVREIYTQRLLEAKAVQSHEVDTFKHEVVARLDAALAASKDLGPQLVMPPFGGVWKGMSLAGSDWSARTQVPAEMLERIAVSTSTMPEGFEVHPKLRKLLQSRRDMGAGKAPVDWGTAEMFALGSLLLEGTPIRFVGQDVQRGTFSHRHASLHDYNTGAKYFPLANLSPDQAPFIIVNTMLSELAVLGFEYGFSTADPRNLVVWEAQFGDFVNGAQPIIDQFIIPGESKWRKGCGLVMLLPHGFEGQGPEHSNGYMERFLQGCAENNIQVCMPTLPAQYFHLMRRQMRRTFRKPLVCFTPKSLLRSDQAVSKIEDFTQKTFDLVLDDPQQPAREKVRRVVFCTGKVYYTLHAARQKSHTENAAIVRIEQLYPFPQKEVQAILARYNAAHEVIWVQEEPKNRGAWTFMEPRLRPLLSDVAVLSYVGRDEAASPAVGSYAEHNKQEQRFIAAALDLPAAERVVPRPSAREAAKQATPVSD